MGESFSIRVAGERDRAGAERLIRSTFSMDQARYRLMYERDPRCRPENLYVAIVDDEVVGVNGFREVELTGLFADGRSCGRGIVSGGTAIRPEYRLRGMSKAIFHQAWRTLGSKYGFCLGFTRQELYAGYLRAIGFAAARPGPVIAYEKRLVSSRPAPRAWNVVRTTLIRLKFRSGMTKPPPGPGSPSLGLRLTPMATDHPARVLDSLYRAKFARGTVAAAVRSQDVWEAIVREREVSLLEAIGTPSTPVGYAVVRTLDDELFVEELVAPDSNALIWLVGRIEDLARSLSKRRVRIRGDPTHIGLCRRKGRHSAFEVRYLALLRPFGGLVEKLTSPHGRICVRDDFLDETYEFGEGSDVLEVALVDLTEYLWGTMSLSKMVKRVREPRAPGRLTDFLADLRTRNAIRPLSLPYLELY